MPRLDDGTGYRETDTSREAAEHISKTRGKVLLAKVLNAYQQSVFGMTADECADALGESILAIRPRVSELKRAGKLADTLARRKNSSGRNAAVFKALV